MGLHLKGTSGGKALSMLTGRKVGAGDSWDSGWQPGEGKGQ